MIGVLNEELRKYRDSTEIIINHLVNDDYDSILDLFNNRQLIIDRISKIDYEKPDFISVSQSLGILDLEKKLNRIMEQKKNEVKIKLSKITTVRNVNSNYNKSNYVDSILINKKV